MTGIAFAYPNLIGSAPAAASLADAHAEHVALSERCKPSVEYRPVEAIRYLATYELEGHQFETTTDHEPGDRIMIRLKS